MAQAGWYHDPVDAAQLRYFDGDTWTEHLQPAPSPITAPQRPSQQPAPQEAPASAEERAWAALAQADAMTPGPGRQRARAEAQRLLQRAQAGKADEQEPSATQTAQRAATPAGRRSRGVRGHEIAGAAPSLGIAFLVNTICALLYAGLVYVTQLMLESLASSAPAFLVTVFSPILRLFTMMGLQGFFFWMGVTTGLITLAYLYAYAKMLAWAFGAAAPGYRLRANGPFTLMIVMTFVLFVSTITMGLMRINEPAVIGLIALAYLFVAMPVMLVNAELMKAAATFTGPLAVTVMLMSVAGFLWIGNKAGSFVDGLAPQRVAPAQQRPQMPPAQEHLQPGAGTVIR